MKKRIILILLAFLALPVATKALATNFEVDEYRNIYIFYENEEEIKEEKEWLEEYQKESSINIQYININENNELYEKTKESLSIKENKTPLAIIGSNYFVGFDDKMKNELTKAMKSYDEVDRYCDIVSKVRNNEEIKECLEVNKGIYQQSTFFSIILKIISVLMIVCLIIGGGIFMKKKIMK